ncbi:hypothetical protein [Oceaniglobus roseus]|nr:hypothetical protein [Kandeliimicrobium roseum]
MQDVIEHTTARYFEPDFMVLLVPVANLNRPVREIAPVKLR